jgi:hypothetical protein
VTGGQKQLLSVRLSPAADSPPPPPPLVAPLGGGGNTKALLRAPAPAVAQWNDVGRRKAFDGELTDDQSTSDARRGEAAGGGGRRAVRCIDSIEVQAPGFTLKHGPMVLLCHGRRDAKEGSANGRGRLAAHACDDEEREGGGGRRVEASKHVCKARQLLSKPPYS